MLKKQFTSLFGCAILCLSLFLPLNAFAGTEALNSANGKYAISIQQINCPSDRATYGKFRDYGYWGGGAWCGQTGKAGFWVWVYPNWYVWQEKMPAMASANGKYTTLLQQINCPSDRSTYGEFRDYGYWGGGVWCGQTGKAGHWVWVYPYWYVWQNKLPPMASANGKYTNLLQQLNCPSDRSTYGDFNDYGYWGGGQWCSQAGKKGHWVWVYPNWYVWENKVR